MKRCLVRICVLLVLGAIVNVAVPWGLCYWCTPECRGAEPKETPNHDVVNFTSPGVTTRVILLRSGTGETAPGLLVDWLRYVASTAGTVNVTVEAVCSRGPTTVVITAGWPFEAVRGREDIGGTVRDAVDMRQTAIVVVRDLDGRGAMRLLPLIPIWPGFAINTVFYAGVLWLLFAAPFALRRRRRIKRGLCPKCAYDLRGTTGAACPECGATR